MVMQDHIIVDGTDLTSYRRKWKNTEEWDSAIGSLTIEFGPSVKNIKTLETGMSISVQRGFTTATDEYVFIGVITQVKPKATAIVCECKNPLYDAIKSRQTKSWDKNIDIEAGVGSELFKSICDNSGINYTSVSVPTTGVTDAEKITKLIQNDEDDFDRLNYLAKRYNRVITYDYDNDIVVFKPKGFVVYPTTLTVGIEIKNQLVWKENMEQLINKVTINGATVYDRLIQSFAGPGTTFTLTNTPEDTEVHINHATTDDLQVRGQKDVGTIGTDFDYYIDVEQKQIVFGSSVSDVWINYGAQVPMPVIRKNQTSIDKYGGPNKKPHHRKFTFNDLKDIADAENRAGEIIKKYSVPFNEVQNIDVDDTVLTTHGNFTPGHLIHVIDIYNDKDIDVLVKMVEKSWPHLGDKITVGDEIWRTEDWQASISKQINQLFNELNKNQDILNQMFDSETETVYERRYFYLYKRDQTNDGAWGIGFADGSTSTRYDWGDTGALWQASYTNSFELSVIQQGQNIYREFLYDDEFEGTGTGTWNTVTEQITFTSGQIKNTSLIALGHAYTHFTVSIASLTGSVKTEISGDGGSTWQTVTLDLRTAFSTSTTSGVMIRFTENAASTATIENTYKTNGTYDNPAIYCKLEG